MSKQKTKRGWAKRAKKRKSGVISRTKAGLRHNLGSKSKKRKRRLRKAGTISRADRRRLRGLI